MSDDYETEEIRHKLRPLYSKALFLFAVLLFYLILGAVLFQVIEHSGREHAIDKATEELDEERAELLKALWAETIAKSEDDWALVANQRLDMYERTLQQFKGIVNPQDEEPDNPWTFIGSVFYCFTLVTTIGYGNIAPLTVLGKVLTIFYALVGIPLTLYYLAIVGKLLTLMLKFLLRKNWSHYDSSEDFNFSPILAVVFTFSYLMAGTLLFDFLEEDWDLVDAGYFSFISSSTVGFGDLVPQGQWHLVLLMCYSFGALSLCSMCFVVIQSALETFLNKKQDQLSEWWGKTRQFRAAARAKKSDDEGVSKIPRRQASPAKRWATTADEDEEIEADEVEEEEEES